MSRTRNDREAPAAEDPRAALHARRDANLRRIRRVVAVMSGKGGVGKSTVAAALALALARRGKRTGLLDVDFHGPSIPTLLGLVGARPVSEDGLLRPTELGPDLKVMSLGLLLGPSDEAVIWRGPMKIGVIDQLLGDVAWGDLDFLVIDCPPGTGDEPLSIAQVIPSAEVVMVGTPQEVAMADVRKSAAFCRRLGLEVLGLVETMGSLACPHCGKAVPLFRAAAAARPADLPVLAEIPFDPALHEACDRGTLADFLASGSPTARRLADLAARIAQATNVVPTEPASDPLKGASSMRYAIPTADGRLALHFGHVDQFTFIDVTDGTITAARTATPPPHAPGVLPAWCKEQGVGVVIAGGMGSRAQDLFAQHGIQLVIGAPADPPEDLVRRHLAGALQTGDNVCDH
jgi:Mrp family chromosome partitioning ATPase/predicted Fe-Mo cluster-binding NifX family protein